MKDRVVLAAFLLGAIVGGGVCAIWFFKLRAAPTAQHDDAGWRLALQEREIARQDHWHAEGFVQMVPPVDLPQGQDGADQIRVWLKIPEGGVLRAPTRDGVVSLDFPPGTVADRVESIGLVVSDVRGTRLLDDGELFHVYLPRALTPDAPLLGWEWPRGDVQQESAATEQLMSFLRTGPLPAGAADPARARERRLLNYRRNNDCARCHVARKPETHGADDAIHRATDDDGWFVPLSVLFDEGPIERHRPEDPNVDDPFVSARCAQGSATVREVRGQRRYGCDDGSAVIAHYDLSGALAAQAPKAAAICSSRRYLYDHMDADARRQFSAAFVPCQIP